MKMETDYELDSVSELPPVPMDFDPMEYSGNYFFTSSVNTLESLVPFPSSDFSPSCFSFLDHDRDHAVHAHDLLQLQPGRDSLFQDSPLSMPQLNLHHAEPTRFDELFFYGGAVPDATTSFLRMPDLQSIEQTTTVATAKFSCVPSPPPSLGSGEKRRCFCPDVAQTFDSFVKSGFAISSSSASASHGRTARVRRQKIAEKTRSLEKLMPWEKKMDMATLLEEAHKYIKFLQAQIAVLRWMPLQSAYYPGGGGGGGGGRGGDASLLRMLNRQQILQVLANSPAVQTMLYTRGCCVFSREQLLSLKMMAQTPRNL